MSEWALYNALKGWTLYDLTISEVQLLIQVMSANEVKLTQVCRRGAAQWKPLSAQENPDFFLKKTQNADNYPPIPQDKTSSGIDTDYFVVRPRKQLPRLHKRYDVTIACTLFSTNKSFETESVNLSEGGLQFKDLLPDWIAGYFIVGVTTQNGLVQLMCSLVEDQKEKKRVQIVSEDTDPQYMLYRHWLSSLP